MRYVDFLKESVFNSPEHYKIMLINSMGFTVFVAHLFLF